MTECLIDFFKKQDVEYKENFDISKISSIGIGGVSDLAVSPHDERTLINTVNNLEESKVDFRVVGRMTNTLQVKSRYNGVLILTDKMNDYFVAENTITTQCGVLLSRLLRELSELSLGVCEELYGIPGSVGGMVFGNAGAFGKSIADCLNFARLYLPKERRIVTLSSDEMKFSYRSSIMKERKSVLISATFALYKSKKSILQSRMKEFASLRKSTQPYGEKSLGSIFKRCGDIPLSRLIDELGFKGYSIGGAAVSEKHAGFIVNRGGAGADDVINLINLIKARVYSSYGIVAEEEIQYL